MKILNNYIAIEGIDGAGTTTQVLKLEELIKKDDDIDYIVTNEPANSNITKLIRHKLNSGYAIKHQYELALLFAADRLEHHHRTIIPAIESNKLIISDRSIMSSYVYQSVFTNDLTWIKSINKYAIMPNIIIYLDIDAEIAMKRMLGRNKLDSYEKIDLLVKYRKTYIDLIDKMKNDTNILILDGTLPVDDITTKIYNIIYNKNRH